MKTNKKLLATFLFGGLATTALATETSDTLVIEDVSKVKIETRDTVQRIVISGAKDDPDFHYVQRISIPDTNAVRRTIRSVRDFNKISIKRKGKDTKWSHSLHFNIGLNSMLDTPDGYDFKLWPSFEVGVGSTWDWHPYGRQNEWSIGWGLNWRYFRFDKNHFLRKQDPATNWYMVPVAFDNNLTDTYSGVHVFSLQLPLIYTHYFDKDRDWSLAVGAIVNWNVSGSANRTFTNGLEDYDISDRHLGQMPFTFDGIVKIGTPWLPEIYCKYSPSKFFRESRGPKMHALSVGFCF